MNDQIDLMVKDQAGSEIMFKMRPTGTIRTLLVAHCKRLCLNPDTVLLKVQGSERYLMPDETVNSAGLTSGDVLEVVS